MIPWHGRSAPWAALLLVVSLTALLALFPLARHAEARKPVWPGDAWMTSTPEAQGVETKPLADLLAAIRREGHAVDSVTVVRHGVVILDAYIHPFRKGLRHPVYSVTKSFASTLVGLALQQGALRGTDQMLSEFFPEAREAIEADARKRAVTLEHLLTMTSGLDCKDSYKYARKGLHVMRETADWTRYALALPMAEAPGGHFLYCNAVSFLLTAIVERATGIRPLEFARSYLFDPIGIQGVEWEAAPEGTQGGFSGLWLTPHDMARFGWLILNRGLWQEKRVLSEAWIERATRGHVDADVHPRYGYQWWVESDGSFMALGAKGQGVFVYPELDMVVVFTSNLPAGRGKLPYNLVRRFVLPAVKGEGALPANPTQARRLARLTADLAAEPPGGWRWKSEADGVMRHGVFTRSTEPAFTLTPPPGSRRKEVGGENQFMRLETLSGVEVVVLVLPAPRGVSLDRLGPGPVLARLRRRGEGHAVAENVPVTFADGSPGYRTLIRWRSKGGLFMRTVAVSALRGGSWVLLLAYPWKDDEDLSWLVDTVRFDKTR